MWQRLLDENTWHGKFIKGVVDAPKVIFVLLYFAGIFTVIIVDSMILRRRNRAVPKRVLRTGGARSSRLS